MCVDANTILQNCGKCIDLTYSWTKPVLIKCSKLFLMSVWSYDVEVQDLLQGPPWSVGVFGKHLHEPISNLSPGSFYTCGRAFASQKKCHSSAESSASMSLYLAISPQFQPSELNFRQKKWNPHPKLLAKDSM